METKKPVNVLFVCFHNQNRSVAATKIYKEQLEKLGYKPYDAFDCPRDYDYYVISAGTSPEADGNELSLELVGKMDKIFALDPFVKRDMVTIFNIPEQRIITLGIPDMFQERDGGLRKALEEILQPYLPERKQRINNNA